MTDGRRWIGRAATSVVVAVVAALAAAGGGSPAGAACTPPFNDALVSNTPLVGASGSITQSMECTTAEAGEPHHGGTLPISSLWYRWRNPSSTPTQVQLWTTGSTVDTKLAVYLSTAPEPTFASLVARGSNDDAAPGVRWSQLVVNVPGGDTLFVAVDRAGLPEVGKTSSTLRWRFSYAPFEAPATFVRAFYRDFQGRQPTASELSYEVDLLSRQPAEEVALRILDHFGGASVNDPVARLYRAYFARRTDGAGLQYWAAQLRAGRSLTAVSDFFSKSQEFRTKYGPLTSTAFVNLVYTNVLGRAASDADRTYWVGRLGAGYSRSKLMLQFAQSQENRVDSDRRIRTDVISSVTHVAIADPGRRALPDGGVASSILLNQVLRNGGYAT